MSSSDNINKVPLKQWKRWTPAARKVFNETYETMNANQGLFQHPKTAALPQAQWTTTAWNAAWIAADAVVAAQRQEAKELQPPAKSAAPARKRPAKSSSSLQSDDLEKSVKCTARRMASLEPGVLA
jgi:hypothetical protein